jgi:hypothetical protein
VNEYGLALVNFKKFVHKGELISDELYVLTTQVDQVFYVEDERDLDWACNVRTKPNNVYDVGYGEGHHDACANYQKCKPLLLTSNNDHDP